MAKITDYASLSAAVVDHTTRDDLADSMDRFVQMAEQAMRRRLRTLDTETTVALTITDGVALLPSDLLSIRAINAVTDEGLESLEGTYIRTGSTVTLSPAPEEDTVEITYAAAFTPLEPGTTNWIIRDHPDLYFHGTLEQAFSHYRDMEAMVVHAAAFQQRLDEVARSRNADRWGTGPIAPSVIQQVSGARC